MKYYPFTLICSFAIILLSGCHSFVTKTAQEESKIIEAEPADFHMNQITEGENLSIKQEGNEVIRGRMIDEHIVSTIGESTTFFQNYGDMKVKVHIGNTGTESFVYKIRSIEDYPKVIVTGVLKTNESFQQVFDQLPEGFYAISTVVQEEDMPIEIALSLKVDLIEYE